ncbi:LuxR C-terminal-related transcriptional regulator, partial [Eubacteriales bacterium OttesenSCG-928-N14]|nr:LuxR C-terminal-related transcriptional regulator [Eubacteriales bacterium OttesenSCG-928-N14]
LVEYSHALNLSSAAPGEVERSLQMDFEGMPYVSRVLHGAGYGREYLASAEAAVLKGNLKQAQKDAYTAIYHAKEQQQTDIVYNAMFWLLRIGMLNGDADAMQQILTQLQAEKQRQSQLTDSVLDIVLGWFYSEYGMVDKVAGWVLYDQQGNQPPISVDRDTLLRVRCLIVERKYYEALALLSHLEEICRKRNSLITLMNVTVYQAVVHYQLDDMDAASAAIAAGYEIAKGDELYMPFVIYGHMTRSLFENLAKQKPPGLPGEWLEQMRTRSATYAKRHAYLQERFTEKQQKKEYGLTERESELLRNLSQGLNRDEMAQSMYVSPHTIKSMLKTVYNKIGAINSADAVRIAVSEGLI